MKKNMSKVLALLAVVAMLCGLLPTGFVLPTMAASDVANLIKNGDFENSSISWTVNGGTVGDGLGANSTSGLNVSGWNNATQTIAVEKNTKYIVSFDYKGSWGCLYVKNQDGSATIKEEWIDSGEWKAYAFIIESGENASITVEFSGGGNGGSYFDNAALFEFSNDNLLTNGDFENGSDGWTLNGGSVSASIGNNSTQGALSSDWNNVAQKINVEQNTKYVIYFNHKGSGGALYIKKQDGSSTLKEEWLSGDSWSERVVAFDSQENTSVTFELSGGGSTGAYYDNVTVFAVPAVREPSSDGFITNGDFETGDMTGGWYGAATITTDAAKDGQYGAYITGGEWDSLENKVSVNKNKEYKLTFNAYGSAWGWVPVYVKSGDGSTELVGKYYNTTGEGWQTFEYTFNSGEFDTIYMQFAKGSEITYLYVDNVKLTEVKDPSFDGFITNGDFETGDMTGGWYGAATITTDAAKDGQYGAYITGGEWDSLENKVSVNKNKEYKLTFNAYGSVWGWAPVYVKSGDGSTELVAKYYNTTSEGWQTFEYSFNSGEFDTVYIQFAKGSNNTYLFVDNVKLTEVKDPSSDGFITNGDFETGDMTGWTTYDGITVDSKYAHNGDYGVGQDDGSWRKTTQTFSVEKNTKYRLTLWYKGSISLYVKNGDESHTYWDNDISGGKPTVDSYTQLSYEFDSSDYDSVLVEISTNSGAWSVDDVKVEKVKGPSFDGYITNGDFETGDMTGWTTYDGITVDSKYAHNGDYGVGQDDGSWRKTTQTFSVEKNTKYRLTLWYKGSISLYVKNGDESHTYWDNNISGGKPTVDSYTKLSYEFDSSDYDSVLVEISTNSGAWSVDDVKVEKVKAPSFDGYITNGDFETGDTTGWSGNGTVSTEAKHNDSYGISVNGGGWDQINQTINVEKNKTYKVSFYYKGEFTNYNKINGETIWDNNVSGDRPYVSDWTYFEFDISSGDYTQIYLEFSAGAKAAGFSLDDVKVVEVKDPSFDGYIYNGDFETGNMTGGWYGSIEVNNEAVKDGYYGVKVSGDYYSALENKSIAVAPNTNYVLCFDHMSPTGVQGCVYIKGVKNGNVDAQLANEYPKCDAGQWVSDSVAFNSGEYSMIYIQLCVAEGGYRYYDNVKLISISDTFVTGGLGSVTESGDKVGVAFKFDLDASVTFEEPYTFTAGTVVPMVGGSTYNLVKMGAVLTNKTANVDQLSLESVDSKNIIDIVGEKVIDVTGDSVSYAVRVINVPFAAKGVTIYARPYYIYNDGTKDVVVYSTTIYSESFNSIENRISYTDNTQWELYWNEEFGGTKVDQTKWSVSVGDDGGVAYKTNRPENVKVENGDLVLTAKREEYNGKDYTIGYVGTSNKFSFLYGRMEIRAKMPTGHGVWPALWTMGDLYTQLGDEAGWPYAGEIDILEIVGEGEKSSEANRTHTHNLHWGLNRNEHCEVGSYMLSNYNNQYTFDTANHPADVYHVYAIEWAYRDIKFYVDDVMVSHVWWSDTMLRWQNVGESAKFKSLSSISHNDNDGGTGTTAAALDTAFSNPDNPHWLIMNVGLNEGWGDGSNAVNESTPMPTSMYVDYVRVYKAAE